MKRFPAFLALAAMLVVLALPVVAGAQAAAEPAPIQKQQATPATQATPAVRATPAKPAATKRVDLNAASRDDLLKLPRMTEATADKIIAGRPYKSLTQLKTKKILTPAEYGKLRRYLMVKRTAPPRAANKPAPAAEPKAAK